MLTPEFAGKGKGKARAQWVSNFPRIMDVWEGRRSLGQYLRCGADDRQIRECEMLLASRPAAATGMRVLEAEVNDAVDSESENDHP